MNSLVKSIGWCILTAGLMLGNSAGAQTTRPESPTTQPTTRPGADVPNVPRFVQRIETAHNRAAWESKKAIACDIEVSFGGATMLKTDMLYDIHSGRARMTMGDGTVLVFDGSKAWVSPSSSPTPMARFHLLTWPYFVAAPFKLRDPGSHLKPGSEMTLNENSCETAKLTFDSGVGDSPEDWYVLYLDPAKDRLAAMAYIVTYGTPVEVASTEPHAITFESFKDIDGVVLSEVWKFWPWSEEAGVHGESMGEAKLTNIRFVTPDAKAFIKPEDAREDALPGS